MHERIDEFCYEIDDANHIIDVDRPWLAFARSNGAPELTRQTVIGANLFRFISGWETIKNYRHLFDALRGTGERIMVPFRCDTPQARRYMALTMYADPVGHIYLAGRLLARAARRHVPLLDPSSTRNGQLTMICSVCLRVETGQGEWREIETALPDPYALPPQGLPHLSHGFCPECAGRIQRAIHGAQPQ